MTAPVGSLPSSPAALARALFVGMVLEFLLLHSYAFLNLATGVEKGASFGERLRGSLAVIAFGSFYLLMAGCSVRRVVRRMASWQRSSRTSRSPVLAL